MVRCGTHVTHETLWGQVYAEKGIQTAALGGGIETQRSIIEA
jgi:hypothetical protein